MGLNMSEIREVKGSNISLKDSHAHRCAVYGYVANAFALALFKNVNSESCVSWRVGICLIVIFHRRDRFFCMGIRASSFSKGARSDGWDVYISRKDGRFQGKYVYI